VPVPPGVVTTRLTAPAFPAGETAVISEAFTTVNAAALVPPKETAVAPSRLDPVIVTEVPPARGPAEGVAELMDGAA
jgi:hypothetical protein